MAITKDLAPGDYTATYSKDGYKTASVTFSVSSTGVVTCSNVDGNHQLCTQVTIAGRKLTFHMTEVPRYTTSIVSVTPNKTSYNVGDRATITCVVKNTGNVGGYLAVKIVDVGQLTSTNIWANSGETKTLTPSFTIPSGWSGNKSLSAQSFIVGHPVTDTKAFAVTVAIPCPTPSISSITASPSAPKTGESVSFGKSVSAGSGQSITKYAWDFGDGSTGEGTTIAHTYATAKTYSVKLTVTNSCGKTATKTISIVVTQATFTVEFVSVPSGATITVT